MSCCECPPGDIGWRVCAEDQQAEHRMPPLLNIREVLLWCKMIDEATNEMQKLKTKGGEAERAASDILDILDNIRKWLLQDSALSEGMALLSLWELLDARRLEPWLPSVLRTMERQLRENTAVNAHFYALEAVNGGSLAGPEDEFIYFCEVQLNCEYNKLVHSRIMQAYHKTMKEEVLFRSLSQKLKARRGCKRKARKPRVRQWDGTGEWVRDNTAVTLREEQEGLTEKAIYTQRNCKRGTTTRLLPAYIGYQWEEVDEDTEVKSILPYPETDREWPSYFFAARARQVRLETNMQPEYIGSAQNYTPDQHSMTLKSFTEVAEMDFSKVD